VEPETYPLEGNFVPTSAIPSRRSLDFYLYMAKSYLSFEFIELRFTENQQPYR
jgi:hypothetical protein